MSALSKCPNCGEPLGARFPDIVVFARLGDGEEIAHGGQRSRVLQYFDSERGQWRTEADATIALGSTEVHSRMADLKRLHDGTLFEKKRGPSLNGKAGRNLYRLLPQVSLRYGRA